MTNSPTNRTNGSGPLAAANHTDPDLAGTSRLIRSTIAGLIALAAGAACDRSDPTPPELLASFVLNLPASVVETEPFDLSVTAVGDRGGSPYTGFTGQVAIEVEGGGSIEPATLDLASGIGSTAAVISGVIGAVTVRAVHEQVSGSAGTSVVPRTVVDTLPGDPEDPATEAIPDLAFEARFEDFSDGHPELGGLFVSFNTVLLSFTLETTIGEANELLREIDAEIVGGIPGYANEVEGILFLRVPTTSHEQMIALLASLRGDDRVTAVAADVLVDSEAAVPGPNTGVPANPGWRWTLPPSGGNWGLERVRAPQMWNLNDAVRRSGNRTITGVFDAGFTANHEDLNFLVYQNSGPTHSSSRAHGTHVAGIIGATWGNRLGVDGINPFADLVARRSVTGAPADTTVLASRRSMGEAFVRGIRDMILARNDMRVINVSMGFNWHQRGVNPDENSAARVKVFTHGSLLRNALRAVAQTHTLPLIVTSAGNSSAQNDRRAAVWNDPLTFAALDLEVPGIFVVEAVALHAASPGGARRSPFSNVDGHISAPGSDVLSTANDFISDGNLFIGDYQVKSGTSMAAPHVTGLIGYLLALEPSLTEQQIRTLLNGMAVEVAGGASRRIDAFASAMGIDAIRGDRRLQRALVDVSDGSPDGNQRQKVFDDDPDPNTIHTADQRRGDGEVTMRDFRAFRDGVLDATLLQEGMGDLPIILDGPANHFKRDLNEDGCVRGQPANPAHPRIQPPSSCANAPPEPVYSRFDFNGNGLLDWNTDWLVNAPVAPFKIHPSTECQGINQPAGCLRDIDVMMEVWDMDAENVRPDATDDAPVCNPPAASNPPPGWTATGLLADRNENHVIDYFASTDLRIRSDAANEDAGLVIRSRRPAGAVIFNKCRYEAYDGMLTVPVYFGGAVVVNYTRTVSAGGVEETRAFELNLRPHWGEDLGLVVAFDTLDSFSTARERDAALFPRNAQLESLTRPSNPEGTGAFAMATAGDRDELEQLMFELADEHVLPRSLLAGWLGGAEVVLPAFTDRCVGVIGDVAAQEDECVWVGHLWGALMTAKE